MSLEALSIALAHLGCCLSHQDRSHVLVVHLPRDTWLRLKHAAMAKMVEQCGESVFVIQSVPPEGESWANGFWWNGSWIKCQDDRQGA